MKNILKIFLFIFTAIINPILSFSQTETYQQVSNTSDTIKTIEILSAKNLRQITIDDSTVLETLAGNASVKQGNTLLEGDSIVLNKRLGTLEVFGHVHINDADTVNTYSGYLKYLGNEQVAYLKNNVKFSDGKAMLNTNNLEYNIKTGIAVYKEGGKVINGKTTLTSKEAVYYSDTRDVFFKDNVHLKDPKYDMKADSLRYNTALKNAYFISPTHIKTSEGTIDTKSGNYNMETGEAVFWDRTVIRDSSRYISGNKVAFDEKNSIIQIEGNGKFVDSANNVIVLGNQILIDKKNNSFLSTRKPVMIIYKNNNSYYISADTLFSGRRILETVTDSLQKTIDTVNDVKLVNTQSKKADSIRYFIGFHHVKIFNDSLQAVCDSLHYSTIDSTFKLLQHPVCWNGNTQITGDTMILATEKQKAKQLSVYNNSILINKTKEGFFNQMSGKSCNAYFKDGNIDYVRTKGSPAESIFYVQDDDSAYVGMDRSKADAIDVLFEDKKIYKIKYINDAAGILYPMKQIPTDKKKLKNFIWRDNERPKSKLEIFE